MLWFGYRWGLGHPPWCEMTCQKLNMLFQHFLIPGCKVGAIWILQVTGHKGGIMLLERQQEDKNHFTVSLVLLVKPQILHGNVWITFEWQVWNDDEQSSQSYASRALHNKLHKRNSRVTVSRWPSLVFANLHLVEACPSLKSQLRHSCVRWAFATIWQHKINALWTFVCWE